MLAIRSRFEYVLQLTHLQMRACNAYLRNEICGIAIGLQRMMRGSTSPPEQVHNERVCWVSSNGARRIGVSSSLLTSGCGNERHIRSSDTRDRAQAFQTLVEYSGAGWYLLLSRLASAPDAQSTAALGMRMGATSGRRGGGSAAVGAAAGCCRESAAASGELPRSLARRADAGPRVVACRARCSARSTVEERCGRGEVWPGWQNEPGLRLLSRKVARPDDDTVAKTVCFARGAVGAGAAGGASPTAVTQPRLLPTLQKLLPTLQKLLPTLLPRLRSAAHRAHRGACGVGSTATLHCDSGESSEGSTTQRGGAAAVDSEPAAYGESPCVGESPLDPTAGESPCVDSGALGESPHAEPAVGE